MPFASAKGFPIFVSGKQQMARNKKLHAIAALMSLSEVLLFFFLGFWIKGQYQKENTLLKEELSASFRAQRSK